MAIPASTSNGRPPMIIVDMLSGIDDMVNDSIAGRKWTLLNVYLIISF
jgi:hypothetical protein